MRPLRTVIYPGSFDPLTNGHLDIVSRAARLLDRVVVAVARNESKSPLFNVAERLGLMRDSVTELPNARAQWQMAQCSSAAAGYTVSIWVTR